MQSRIIHPKMMQMLERDFFPAICTIQEPTKTQGSTGEEKRTYAARIGLEAVPCRVAPAGGGERRTSSQVYLDSTHTIVLSGQFDQLTTEMKAVVDLQTYDILLIEPDSEGVTTRLTCRIVT